MPKPTMHLGHDVCYKRWRQIESGMVTGCKIKHLRMIYLRKSGKTRKRWDFRLQRIEISNVCMAWASFSTQPTVLRQNYETDIEDVKEAVRRDMDGPGQLLGYRSMQQKVRELHGLNVPRDVVYPVMKEVSPEGLQGRGGVGKAKRHRKTNPFVTGVSKHFPGLTGSLLCNGRTKTGCSAFWDCSYSRNLMRMTFDQALICLSCVYVGPRSPARSSHSQNATYRHTWHSLMLVLCRMARGLKAQCGCTFGTCLERLLIVSAKSRCFQIPLTAPCTSQSLSLALLVVDPLPTFTRHD